MCWAWTAGTITEKENKIAMAVKRNRRNSVESMWQLPFPKQLYTY